MTMNMIPFRFDTAAIRVVEIDGEPWFVGRDITSALGYSNAGAAISQHCKGVVKHDTLQTAGGVQEVRIICESDVMRLIVNSALPSAARMERWLFEEVLPTIRRTGSYAPSPIPDLNDPGTLRSLLLDYSDKVIALEAEVAEQAPAVAALDRLTHAEGAMCMSDAAKHMQVPPLKFINWLHSIGWIYRRVGHKNWLAYQTRIASGDLAHKVRVAASQVEGEGERIYESVLVTAQGMANLAKRIERAAQRRDDAAREAIGTIKETLHA